MEHLNVKNGSIQFWGEWFGGRPLDNYHKVIETYWDKDNILIVKLDQGEVVTIHDPMGIVSTEKEFSIKEASRIIFEWFYYGRECAPENLCCLEYRRVDDDQVLCTRTDIVNNCPCEKNLHINGLVAMRIV